jgi:hypothetical protein
MTGTGILLVIAVLSSFKLFRDSGISVRDSELAVSALDASRVLPLEGYPVLEPESGP